MSRVPSKSHQHSQIPIASRVSPEKCKSIGRIPSKSATVPFFSSSTVNPIPSLDSNLDCSTKNKSNSSLSEFSENDKNDSSSLGSLFKCNDNRISEKLSHLYDKRISNTNYSSTNMKINISHKSMKSKTIDLGNSSNRISSNQSKGKYNSIESLASTQNMAQKTLLVHSSNTVDSSRPINRMPGKQSINRSSSLSSGFSGSSDALYERQLQEKDFQIQQLLDSLRENESLTQNLYYELDKKDKRFLELVKEIKMRKEDMAEMSRKVIAMDRDLKMYQKNHFEVNKEIYHLNRPYSELSFPNCTEEQTKVMENFKWFSLAPLRFKKTQHCSKESNKSNTNCINELKNILKEKEMIITDLKLDSKLTIHKLEQMKTALRQKEQESVVMRQNNVYLEKAIKSKLID